MEVWAVPDNLAASLMLSASPPPFLAESASLLLPPKMGTQGEKVLQLQFIFKQNCDESCSSKTAQHYLWSLNPWHPDKLSRIGKSRCQATTLILSAE
jgi:hypothetical protein